MKLRVAIFLIIAGIAVLVAYRMNLDSRTLKIYNPAEINPKLVDESKRSVFRNHRIADFNLTDQNGNEFTQENLEGKIYVTDFFFTTCPSICIDMSKHLMTVQDEFENDEEIVIVSHTVQPEVDSVPVLKEYAERHDAIENKWIFLTGDKRKIYDLARKSYFAVTTEGNGDETDFIHTENFVLIDKEKRIRGFYDGTSEKDVQNLIDDIYVLKREYN